MLTIKAQIRLALLGPTCHEFWLNFVRERGGALLTLVGKCKLVTDGEPGLPAGLSGTIPKSTPSKNPNSPHTVMSIDKSDIIKTHQKGAKDTGSPEVQVALITARVNHLTEHLRSHRKDFHSRRGLIMLTNRRRKLLNYLKATDLDRYNALIGKLNLRK